MGFFFFFYLPVPVYVDAFLYIHRLYAAKKTELCLPELFVLKGFSVVHICFMFLVNWLSAAVSMCPQVSKYLKLESCPVH